MFKDVWWELKVFLYSRFCENVGDFYLSLVSTSIGEWTDHFENVISLLVVKASNWSFLCFIDVYNLSS